MRQRYNLSHFILVSVIVLVLKLLMVCVNAQAQIAFMSDRDGPFEIYVMDPDGGNLRRLTDNGRNNSGPSWSPDGKRIAFSSRQALPVRHNPFFENHHGVAPHDIYVMDADGENRKRLTDHPRYDISPSWSPDGRRIAFASERGGPMGIHVMDTDGGNPQRLTHNPFDEREPSWSADGKRIVFSARRKEHFRGHFGLTYEIYVMDADGGNEQRLTENRVEDKHPSWSPDGKRIVFSRSGEQQLHPGALVTSEIYVMDADGGNEQRLTENRFDDIQPSWSPDGQRIVFASNRDNFWNADIYVMDADGGNQQNLTKNDSLNIAPSWFIPARAVSPAGKMFTSWGRLKQVDR